MSATQTSPPVAAPIWPKPLPVIVLTGEKWSGKTLFALSIDPRRTLIYDTEISSKSYQGPWDRVDVMAEMLRLYPGGHKPIDRFTWWLDHVRSIEPGRYTVIVCDTVNEIETGLADWVRLNPQAFGHTAAQYLRMSGLMWGDVKDHWLSIMASELASRCQTFVATTHMGLEWAGDKPTGKRKPKGKETLFQIASLYLQMERKPDPKGGRPSVPSALVLKERTADMEIDPVTGEVRIVSHFPPRLPIATPAEVRARMMKPLDTATIRPEEMAPEEIMTEDDRAAVRLQTAEKEAEVEAMRLDRMQREQAARQRSMTQVTIAPLASPPVAQAAPPASSPQATPTADRATDVQLHLLQKLRGQLFHAQGLDDQAAQRDAWSAILSRRGVTTARDLTQSQATDLAEAIAAKLNAGDPLAKAMFGGDANHP